MSAEVDDQRSDEERRQREREEAIERMLLEQEQEHQVEQETGGNAEEPLLQELDGVIEQEYNSALNNAPNITYRGASFFSAAALIIYAFRSREQYYLAAVFLSSSKWAYVVLGNALIAFLVAVFDCVNAVFLSGLRVQEAEGLQDYFRWNVTETCIALTMFRAEIQLSTAIEFLLLIMVKCLHQVAIMREQLFRVTEDAIVPLSVRGILSGVPAIRRSHVKLFVLLVCLQLVDLWVVQRMAQSLVVTGPSVNILFAFEAAISLVSAWSHLLLWYLHVLDGLLHYGHEQLDSGLFRRILHPWREYKATLTFAVELQAQAIQFLFYLAFFSIVLTYYGMPINLFREVYISFSAFKERLSAFFKYRRLMANMNRFQTASEEELEEQGSVCIICRDEMSVDNCKRLPGCRHIFHKSCLREWLVQQQSCPTCRTDITTAQAQEAPTNAARDRERATQNDSHPDADNGEDARTQSLETREDGSPGSNLSTKHRGKKTRSTALHISNGETEAMSERRRALYRVSASSGTPVTRSDGSFVRFISSGVIVLGLEGRLNRDGQQLLKIPDGWIPSHTVEIMHVIDN